MRICLPTVGNEGLESRLSDHFGSAPHFVFVDVDSGRVETTANPNCDHQPGHCSPTALLEARAVRALVCRGLGRRALEQLAGRGVEVYRTGEVTARGAVRAFLAGELPVMGAAHACGGHDDCDDHHAGGH